MFYYEWPRTFAGKTKGEFHWVVKLHHEREVHSDPTNNVFSYLKMLKLLKL